jgi:hypothetical protein
MQVTKKRRLLFVILGGLLFISLMSLYYKYMVLNDYEIYLAEEATGDTI